MSVAAFALSASIAFSTAASTSCCFGPAPALLSFPFCGDGDRDGDFLPLPPAFGELLPFLWGSPAKAVEKDF